MRCLSCGQETEPKDLHQWRQVLLCTNCEALAKHAEAEILSEFEQAKVNAIGWLRERVLRGGLLAAGDGSDVEG